MTSSCWKKTSPGPSSCPADRPPGWAGRPGWAAGPRRAAHGRESLAEPGQQDQRPVRRAGLHHEVPGEPAAGPQRAPGPLVIGARLVGGRGEVPPLGGRRRAGPAEPGPDHPAFLPRPRGRLHVGVGPRKTPPAERPATARPRRPAPPYIADSSATLALARSPPNIPARAWYRSPDPAASANASITSERGENTRLKLCGVPDHQRPARICHDRAAQPPAGSAAHRRRGLAQRPDTTPPTTYSGWNRPSRTHSSSHAQPCAACSRASSLYSSKNGTAGVVDAPEHA